MFKNAVIAMLGSGMWHMSMCEFSLITFICTAAVLFFVVWAIEDAVDSYKSRKALQRKLNKEIKGIKIIPRKKKKKNDKERFLYG